MPPDGNLAPPSPPPRVAAASARAAALFAARTEEAQLRDKFRDERCKGVAQQARLPPSAYRYQVSERCVLKDQPRRAQQARKAPASITMQQTRAEVRALEKALARGPPPARMVPPIALEASVLAFRNMILPRLRLAFPDPLQRFDHIEESTADATSVRYRLPRFMVLSLVLEHLRQSGGSTK